MTSGVPIRLNSSLFSAVAAHDDDGAPSWDAAVATADIAAEAQQRMREATQRWRVPRPGPQSGGRGSGA